MLNIIYKGSKSQGTCSIKMKIGNNSHLIWDKINNRHITEREVNIERSHYYLLWEKYLLGFGLED